MIGTHYKIRELTVTMRYFLTIQLLFTVTMRYFLNIVTVTMRYFLNIFTVTMHNLLKDLFLAQKGALYFRKSLTACLKTRSWI